jgi:hypothetical protein
VIGPASRCGVRWRSRTARLLPEAARAIAEAIDAGGDRATAS